MHISFQLSECKLPHCNETMQVLFECLVCVDNSARFMNIWSCPEAVASQNWLRQLDKDDDLSIVKSKFLNFLKKTLVLFFPTTKAL